MEDSSSTTRGGLLRAFLIGWLGVLMAAGMGCSSSSGRFSPTGNPLLDVRNPELLARDRVAAAERAWAEVESGVRARERTREAFKSLAWSGSTDESVRLTLIRLLMSDTTEAGSADSLGMARLMLPTERSPQVTRVLAQAAVDRGWVEVIPALVRSYARFSMEVDDRDRIEGRAIAQLRPGVAVEESVYAVFLRPSDAFREQREASVLRAEDRTRDDAWTLLSRLDTDGRVRARLVGGEIPDDADPESVADVGTLRAGLGELGVLPRTGAELAWLRQLHRNADPEIRARNAAWWSEAAGTVGRLSAEQRRGLELRHIEAVRWAGATRPGWLRASRHALLDELGHRLSGRKHHRRDADRGRRARSERLSDWADRMSWGDAVTALAVDEAVASDRVREQIFQQAELDRQDTSTEYGGVIDLADDGGHRAVLFRPRARDRVSDERFVASSDMIRFSDLALAHYHLQVQRKRLSGQAGPSDGDLLYAAESGRTCLVFTSVASDTLNVDLYTPDGVILDLGLVTAP